MSLRTTALAAIVAAAFCSIAILPQWARADPDPAKQPDTKDPKKVDVVDFKKLKELLPETVGDLKRSNAEGGRQSMGEMKLAQAKGTYKVDGKDGEATITILDYGAMPGMAQGVAAWANADIDNESDTEYTKSVEISGFKGLETYNKTNKNGSINMLVGGRFIVTIEISSLASDTLKATAEGMKLKDLAELGK